MVLFNLNLLPWVPVKPSAEEGSGGGGGGLNQPTVGLSFVSLTCPVTSDQREIRTFTFYYSAQRYESKEI